MSAPTTDRRRDAITLAAHIVSENPTKAPVQLGRTATSLWSPNMWRAVAQECGLPQPDTATQALTVKILAGTTGTSVLLTNEAASIAEVALRRYRDQLVADGPGTQQARLLADTDQALAELAPPKTQQAA